MKNTYEDQEKIKKNNEVYLYNLGFEYIEAYDKDIDALIDSHSEIEVPASLDQWFDHFQNENERKNKHKQNLINFKRRLKRIAAVFAIIILANSLLMMRVDAYRIIVLNMFLDTKEKFTQMTNQETTSYQVDLLLPDDWRSYFYPTYVPVGYTLANIDTHKDIKTMQFTSDNNQAFFIIQSQSALEHQLDTENARVIDVIINDHQGKLILKDDRTLITWNVGEKNILVAGPIDKSTILKIAESMTEKK